MNTKNQELVTAGYALAKGLDAESAKLVKELATELAVQRVRADELNKRAVSLAVENAAQTIFIKTDLFGEDYFQPQTSYEMDLKEYYCGDMQEPNTPDTDAWLANIKSQALYEMAVEYRKFADEEGCSVNMQSSYRLTAERAESYAIYILRKEASNDQ